MLGIDCDHVLLGVLCLERAHIGRRRLTGNLDWAILVQQVAVRGTFLAFLELWLEGR